MNTAECIENVVIDICARTFLLQSDKGSERVVECETPEQFMNVLEVCTSKLNENQIEYADLTVYTKN